MEHRYSCWGSCKHTHAAAAVDLITNKMGLISDWPQYADCLPHFAAQPTSKLCQGA